MTISLQDIAGILEKKSAPILIVDDDKEMRLAFVESLTKEGFSVLQAPTATEALAILSSQNISVIVTYHKLQDTLGADLLIKAKSLKPETQRILIGGENVTDHLLDSIHPVQLMVHPWAEKTLSQAVNDSFNQFRLTYEHQSLRSILTDHNRVLHNVRSKISAELALGSKIHQSLLIDPAPRDLPGISVSTAYYISRELDGDFITFLGPPIKYLILCLGM